MAFLRYLGSFFKELLILAKKEKIYWIVPLMVLLLFIALLVFTGQATAPFIYTLF